MAQNKRFEDEGPRIHKTEERDEFEKHPNKVYDVLVDELDDDDLELDTYQPWADEDDFEDNWTYEGDDEDDLPF